MLKVHEILKLPLNRWKEGQKLFIMGFGEFIFKTVANLKTIAGLKFPIWTNSKIRPGNRGANPVSTRLIWKGP